MNPSAIGSIFSSYTPNWGGSFNLDKTFDPHHTLHELGICLFYQGIHGDQSIYVDVDSINSGVQVFEFLLSQCTTVFVQAII